MGRRYAAKVDDNQPEIVAGLRAVGASVAPTHAAGDGFPDLVVGYRGANYLLEVKDENKPPSKRKLTEPQVKFHREWLGQISVVKSLDEAFAVIGFREKIKE
mgnify:CR=1 FL=1